MAVDIILLVLGICLIVVGLIGCVIPAVPGPPLSYTALLLLQATRFANFSAMLLWITAIVTIVVTIIDYIVPAWGTRKFGGSRLGTIGSLFGVFIGLYFLPWGIIMGPFLGAFLGELIAGRRAKRALKAGFGSFIGFLFGVAMKMTVSIVLTYHFFKELFIGIFV